MRVSPNVSSPPTDHPRSGTRRPASMRLAWLRRGTDSLARIQTPRARVRRVYDPRGHRRLRGRRVRQVAFKASFWIRQVASEARHCRRHRASLLLAAAGLFLLVVSAADRSLAIAAMGPVLVLVVSFTVSEAIARLK